MDEIRSYLQEYIADKELSASEMKSLRRYFVMSYTKENAIYKEEVVFTVTLSIGNENAKVAYLRIMTNGLYFDTDFFSIRGLHKDALRVFKAKFAEFLNENDEFLLDLENTYKEQKEKSMASKKEDFVRVLKDISSKTEDIDLLKELDPISVRPVINIRDENYISVSLKLGRDKYYAVNSIGRFIKLVETSGRQKYGKSFEFVHDYSAFDSPSQKLIRYLANNTNPATYNSRQIKLDENLFEYITKIYKDEVIDFEFGDGEKLALSINLLPIHINFKIDKNYLLVPLVEADQDYVIFNKYIISKKNRSVDYFDEEHSIIDLFSAVVKSEYPCIDTYVDDFKYNFILRSPDKFDIDPSIKDEFEFETLTIKAYFDFDELNNITVRDEVYLKDIQVDYHELNSKLAAQYRKYQSILTALGFKEGLLSDDGLIWNFLSSSLESLKQFCEVYLSEDILSKSLSKFNPPTIRINLESNLLDVFMEESLYTDEELYAILDALRKKKKFVLYKDQVINLEGESSQKFLNNVDNYLLNTKGKKIEERQLPIYYAFKALEDSTGVSLNDRIVNIFTEIKNFKNSSFKGGSINGELRNYQLEGIKWLDVLYRYGLNGILADDMGLGKTIEIISFLTGENIKDNVLIVSPKSLIFNWMNEFRKFAPEVKTVPIYGDQKNRKKVISSIKNAERTIFITGYDSLRRDVDEYEDVEFDTVILDEAQYIKNSRTKKSISVNKLNAKHRFVLTGTPIENSVLDLWSIFNFLMPNYLPSEEVFKHRYETDERYISDIKHYTAPFILRRNKKDVLKDLPEKYETIMTFEMGTEQRKVYDAHVLLAKKALDNGEGAFAMLPYFMRLRQICVDPSLFLEGYDGGSGKLEELKEIIADKLADGHRILIFSQFVCALNIVKKYLEREHINHFMITGDTKGEDRVALAEEFNASKRLKIGLISLKAGGTGLNLVGADTVIHLDPWWNIAAENQATDRAHRIGQVRNVEVIKLIALNSIEQRVVELQNIKKDLVDKLIADDDSLITSLSIEDIKFILQ